MSDIFKALGIYRTIDAINYIREHSPFRDSPSIDNKVIDSPKPASYHPRVDYHATTRQINMGRRYREQGPKS